MPIAGSAGSLRIEDAVPDHSAFSHARNRTSDSHLENENDAADDPTIVGLLHPRTSVGQWGSMRSHCSSLNRYRS